MESNQVKIKTSIITGIFAFLVCLQISQFIFAEDKLSDVKEVQDDIRIINLLNSLSLKKEQEIFILNKAKEVKTIKEGAENKLLSRKEDILDTYEGLKEEFSKGKVNADAELTRRFRRQKEVQEKFTKEIHDKLDYIAKEVESNLEEFQIIALKEYTPCIIPSEKSGRIGQADKSTHFEKMLERARNIPQDSYYLKKQEIIDKAVERVQDKTHPGVELDKEKLQVVIAEVVEQARQMDDIDFQLHKQELTEKIQSIINPYTNKEVNTTGRIKRFLLAENIIPILEKRVYRSN